MRPRAAQCPICFDSLPTATVGAALNLACRREVGAADHLRRSQLSLQHSIGKRGATHLLTKSVCLKHSRIPLVVKQRQQARH
jgi:hypothetical protein